MRRLILFVLAGLASFPRAGQPSVVAYRTDAELVAMSDRVVHGRVTALRTEWVPETRAIHTVVTLAVLEDFTGVAAETIELSELGGELDGVGLFVGGAAQFEIGRDVVVCVERFGAGRFRTVSLSFSKFDVAGEGDDARLERTTETVVIGAPGILQAGAERTVGGFRNLVTRVKGTESFRPDVPPAAIRIEPFTQLGSPPIRWHAIDGGSPIVWYHDIDVPAPLNDGTSLQSAIQTALSAWTSAPAAIVLQHGGGRSLGGASPLPSRCVLPGAGVIIFEDPDDTLNGNVLAIGGGCFDPDDTRQVNGTTFRGFTAGFVIFQNAAQLSSSFRQARDFTRVVQHEVGHGIGMGHTQQDGSVANPRSNIMFASCCTEGTTPVPPALGQDDTNGVNFIYPSGSATCTYAISPTSASVAATSGTRSVTVTTESGCAWTASSNTAFLTITSGSTLSGSGAVSYGVAENTGAARTGTLTIAGNAFTVMQATGDSDGDGLPDSWEQFFGLNPNSTSDPDGASGDPDADGRNNLAEYQGGTHPRNVASLTRYFAEGATSSFFDASVALANPGSAAAAVLLRFLRSDGTVVTHTVAVPALARRTVTVKQIAGLATAEFSIVIETDQLVVADRTMSWNASGYGGHSESAIVAPSTTWYLAEGATHSGFNLFYLIQNPNAVAASVTVTYLRPSPLASIGKTYTVAANSRFTIHVDLEDPGLAATDVSAIVQTSATTPVIVERAMYLDTGGLTFGAGHNSAGVTSTSTAWFFAEGATGPYFDLYLLLANPGATSVSVTVTYLLPAGATLVRTYAVDGNSRRTIAVEGEVPELADTALSMRVAATGGIVAERAMWWPGAFATWHEAHNSPGATATGTRWAVAEGEQGATASPSTYILLANMSTSAATVRVTLLMEDGTSNPSRDFTVAGSSRFNVDIRAYFSEATGKKFGALVESLNGVELVVERASYTDAGDVSWAAGTNALATRLQ